MLNRADCVIIIGRIYKYAVGSGLYLVGVIYGRCRYLKNIVKERQKSVLQIILYEGMAAMNEYVLTCCSTADMPREFFEKRNLPCVFYHYQIDSKLYPDDFWHAMSKEEFYSKIAAGSVSTTSMVNVDEFLGFFEPFAAAGKDILHVTLSSGITGSYSAALTAAQMLAKKYPERKIEIVDSLAASSGYGLLMEMMADRRDSGASLAELKAWAELNRLNIQHWFISSDLTSYIRGGRISKAAGLFGTVLNICPLMYVDANGHLTVFEKVRTKKRVFQRVVDKMKQHAAQSTDYSGRCIISHSACYEDAVTLKNLIEASFPKMDGEVRITDVGAVIGSHTGAGTAAVFFWGDKRTIAGQEN